MWFGLSSLSTIIVPPQEANFLSVVRVTNAYEGENTRQAESFKSLERIFDPRTCGTRTVL